MADSGDLTLKERIRQEHAELRKLFGNVHRTLANRNEASFTVEALLQSLLTYVNSHFLEEEETGFFEDISVRAPQLTERVNAVLEEHVRLKENLNQIIGCAAAADKNWQQTLEEEFHDFSKEFMHHEAKENELLQEAYTDDIGAAD